MSETVAEPVSKSGTTGTGTTEPDVPGWPSVSVVMPVRNEAAGLAESVAAVLAQEYPLPVEVCLAVGPSGDDTAAIARSLADADERISVVPNPVGLTPAGLNAAIGATSGEVIVRVDGHARLSDGYIRRAVETLQRTGAANVGGVQDAVGRTPFERAVAAAMTSRFGTGGARFHLGGAEGPVDTVYLGVFRRAALAEVGLFDEELVRNQDYELNIRLRSAGHTVWFDPELAVEYRPRGTIGRLARQYYEYGWWKAVVARRHPGSLRARQIVPAVATAAVAGGLAAGLRCRWAWTAPVAYAAATVAAASARVTRAPGTAVRLLAVYPAIHLAWGAGFIASSLRRRHR